MHVKLGSVAPRLSLKVWAVTMSRSRRHAAGDRTRSNRSLGQAPVEMIGDSSVEARIGRKIVPQPNGCWAFNDDLDAYAAVYLSVAGGLPNEKIRAHRFVYETIVGPIPDEHVLHHTCGNPGCVNPAHLKPMLSGDHTRLHRELVP